MRKPKISSRIYYILGAILFITICSCVCNHIFLIKFSKIALDNDIYGVIDAGVTKHKDNVVYHDHILAEEKTETHGDKLIDFIDNRYSNYTIYYYNAGITGKITEQTIIEGLEWMKANGIKKVNISLSSKKYSQDLQNWIINNKDSITIYASYSNEINTYDYPAMYEGVIGSTGIETCSLKDYDMEYSTNYIVDVKNLRTYKGNSYLSLISMFQN